jgi:hypothetical protein
MIPGSGVIRIVGPIAALPFAYASACVEEVIKRSKKAKNMCDEMVEVWGKTHTQKIREELTTEVPKLERERVRQAFLNPENELYPDVITI